jgi:hypothetical protein
MSNPTSSFGWQMPTASDLVTDLPADFETFGQAVDTTLADLKGGTTGQVLSKASNTDMDFTWVAQDDSNAIQNAIVDAKGDLIAASAADTPARLAVGNNGETLVADSSTSTGLRWQGNFDAGKNKVINGGFDFWQRGTSFSVTAGVNSYAADRWRTEGYSATYAISRQSFSTTTPEVPDSGQYYLRYGITGAPSGGAIQLTQRIEVGNVVSGQTYTLSFWVRAASGTISANAFEYGLITGSANATSYNQSPALTTTWQRVTKTVTLGSGYNSADYAVTVVLANVGSGNTLSNVEFANVQLESGNVATGFARATGTIQGELAACQRYYYRQITASYNITYGLGQAYSTTQMYAVVPFPVPMRTQPTSVEQNGTPGDYRVTTAGFGPANLTSVVAFNSASVWQSTVTAGVASGLVAGNASALQSTNAAYLGWSAEL